MVEQYYPSTTELIRQQRTRRALMTALLAATVTLVFGTIGALMHWTNIPGPSAWLVGVVLFIVLALPVFIWNLPRAGFFVVFAAALLFGGLPGRFFDSGIPTSLVPFWWNISTTGQTFGVRALNGLAFSPAEICMILVTLAWIVRGVAKRDLRLHAGPFIAPLLCYIGMVSFGFFYGKMRGADTTIALWEIRTQFQMLLVYFLAANLITERKHLAALLWLMLTCTSIQSIQAIVKYVSLAGNIPSEGFMIHDDALLMNVGLLACILIWLTKADKKLMAGAFVAAPLITVGILVNNRRGGVGSLMVALIPLLPLVWTVLKERRRQVVAVGVALLLGSAVYFPVAWNGNGPWALPARALRSLSDANERDTSSNNYRLAEDFDLKATRNVSPWTGYGYGRPFLQPSVLPMINFPLKDYLPHNGILWIWMRTGHFGFLAFLMLLFTVIIVGTQIVKRTAEPLLAAFGILAVLNVAVLFVYSKYDMQLISARTVFVMFTMFGALAAISKMIRERAGAADGRIALEVGEERDERDERGVSPVG
jgi:hypothetical protein